MVSSVVNGISKGQRSRRLGCLWVIILKRWEASRGCEAGRGWFG